MKRWNGWGDDSVDYPLPDGALQFLVDHVGFARRPKDATLQEVVASVPASRLPEHASVVVGAQERLLHARGQSLPDWVALRTGRIPAFPDGVGLPSSDADVRELLTYASNTGTALIPYGGGTSVVGHINPLESRPCLTVAMTRMDRLIDLDERSLLATFGAGITGPALEHQLQERGYTLGHFPQSWELSTLGGWIAARSSGQQSLWYGRIEKLFAGARVLSPLGELDLPPFPASAAGPDLREVLLGSEGRMGIITQATVRISKLPEEDLFHGVFFPDWDAALEAVREMSQASLGCSMVRLSSPVETETMLALAGHPKLRKLLEMFLSVRGAKTGRCMLVLSFTGKREATRRSRAAALEIAKRYGAVDGGRVLGKQWEKSRFKSPYLRNTLWEAGYAIDTLETATTWTRVPAMVASIEAALRGGLEKQGEKVHAFSHLSSVYPTGSSIYSTYIFRIAHDPEETLARWKTLKDAASRAIVENKGTITHQHGIGTDHQPWLEAEKGAAGVGAIRSMMRYWDPDGVMNPGKLVGIPPAYRV